MLQHILDLTHALHLHMLQFHQVSEFPQLYAMLLLSYLKIHVHIFQLFFLLEFLQLPTPYQVLSNLLGLFQCFPQCYLPFSLLNRYQFLWISSRLQPQVFHSLVAYYQTLLLFSSLPFVIPPQQCDMTILTH